MSESSDIRKERFHAWMKKVPPGLLSILCLAAIFWLTLAPHPLGDTEIELFYGADKVAHGLMFFGLSLCLLFDLQRHRDWHRLSLPFIAIAAFISMGIGIGIEYLQAAMGEGRQWEFMDIVADSFGAIMGGVLWIFVGGAIGLTHREIYLNNSAKHNNESENSTPK